MKPWLDNSFIVDLEAELSTWEAWEDIISFKGL